MTNQEKIEAIRQAGLLFEAESAGVVIYFAMNLDCLTLLVARKGWSQSFDGLSVNPDGSYNPEPVFTSDNIREALALTEGRS